MQAFSYRPCVVVSFIAFVFYMPVLGSAKFLVALSCALTGVAGCCISTAQRNRAAAALRSMHPMSCQQLVNPLACASICSSTNTPVSIWRLCGRCSYAYGPVCESCAQMLLREGRLAGLGLTPLDDETQTSIQRIDLSMLLTLTPQNYGKHKT